MTYEQGWKIYMAEAIKKAVRVPVIAVGVIREPQFAEQVLKDRKADFLSIGRGLIADPEWGQKAATGREDEIRRCISCNFCYRRLEQSLSLRCAINSDVGFEKEILEMQPAQRKKKVMVIGGGPAGMQAAITASQRGHAVSLFEKDRELGGQLLLAGLLPGKTKMRWLVEYLTAQIRKWQVDTHLAIEVDERKVAELMPEVVVIAAGAQAAIPSLPLKDERLGRKLLTAWDVLKGGRKTSKREEMVVLGGFSLGCEIAAFLAEQGNKVTIISRSDRIAGNTDSLSREELVQQLERLGVAILTGHDVSEITEEGVTLIDKKGDLCFVKADKIVSARLVLPVNQLKKILSGRVRELYLIGDSQKPGQIADAIWEGRRIGRMI
jgi:NADPH-dependent 2,4-dienoyl-CoA reductase/sulfur reductase-like enzyme